MPDSDYITEGKPLTEAQKCKQDREVAQIRERNEAFFNAIKDVPAADQIILARAFLFTDPY